MEAVQGCTKTATFQTDVLCNTCGMLIISLIFICNGFFLVTTIFSLVCKDSALVTNSFFSTFAGGSGVPPGTRPETCKRCKGSGMVSTILKLKFHFFNHVTSLNFKLSSC